MSNRKFFTKLRTIRSRSVLRSQTRVAFLSNIDGVSFCLHVKETSLHIPRHTACISSWSNIYMGHALINFKDTIYYNEDSLLVTVTSKITVNHLNRIFFIDSRFESLWLIQMLPPKVGSDGSQTRIIGGTRLECSNSQNLSDYPRPYWSIKISGKIQFQWKSYIRFVRIVLWLKLSIFSEVFAGFVRFDRICMVSWINLTKV